LRRTVTLTAASPLTTALADALDGLRRPSPAADPSDADPADGTPQERQVVTAPPADEPRPDRRLSSVG